MSPTAKILNGRRHHAVAIRHLVILPTGAINRIDNVRFNTLTRRTNRLNMNRRLTTRRLPAILITNTILINTPTFLTTNRKRRTLVPRLVAGTRNNRNVRLPQEKRHRRITRTSRIRIDIHILQNQVARMDERPLRTHYASIFPTQVNRRRTTTRLLRNLTRYP